VVFRKFAKINDIPCWNSSPKLDSNKKGYVITKSNVFDLKKRDESNTDLLTELLRSGARQLIAKVIEAERR